MENSGIFRLLILVMVLSVMGPLGCKEKTAPIKKPAAQKAQPAGTAPSAPAPSGEGEKIEQQVFSYDPQGRRDPFSSLVEVEKEKPHRKKGASPIENFDVEEIRLIAIAWDSKQYYAMITLPDNKSYTIAKGMTLGLFGGKVHEITKDSVIIREQVQDYKGQIKTKDTTLKLRKEEEE